MHYNSYVLPEQLPEPFGRKPYHSKFELIRTEDHGKEFAENIAKQVNVLRQQEFKAKFPKGPKNTDKSELLQTQELNASLPEPYCSSDYYFFR